MKIFVLSVCVFLIGNTSCSNLPASFKKCNRKQPDFNECLAKATNDALAQLTKPIKELGLPSLEPFEVPSLTIGAGTGAVGVEQKFKNVKFHGLSKSASCTKTTIDFKKQIFTAECFFDKIKLEADYELNGKVLLLDVNGKGKSLITLENVKVPFKYPFEDYQKNGVKYYKVIKGEVKPEPGHMTLQFDNLFNGDKILGDNLNKVLNDNWREIYDDVKSSYNELFEAIGRRFLNSVLERVSAVEMFGEE